MTDHERALEFFRSLGIEPDTRANTSARLEGRHALVLNQENFGGYSGFEATFEFDRNGKYLPNKDNQSKDSNSGVWE